MVRVVWIHENNDGLAWPVERTLGIEVDPLAATITSPHEGHLDRATVALNDVHDGSWNPLAMRFQILCSVLHDDGCDGEHHQEDEAPASPDPASLPIPTQEGRGVGVHRRRPVRAGIGPGRNASPPLPSDARPKDECRPQRPGRGRTEGLVEGLGAALTIVVCHDGDERYPAVEVPFFDLHRDNQCDRDDEKEGSDEQAQAGEQEASGSREHRSTIGQARSRHVRTGIRSRATWISRRSSVGSANVSTARAPRSETIRRAEYETGALKAASAGRASPGGAVTDMLPQVVTSSACRGSGAAASSS